MFSATASEAEAARSKKEVEDLLCKPVLSSENRLKCMKNIGEMAEQEPRILCVQLQSGHSQFWFKLRKVAKAINKQTTQECKLATHSQEHSSWKYVVAVPEKCTPKTRHGHFVDQVDVSSNWLGTVTEVRTLMYNLSSALVEWLSNLHSWWLTFYLIRSN